MILRSITSACSHVLHANVPTISHMVRAEILRLWLTSLKESYFHPLSGRNNMTDHVSLLVTWGVFYSSVPLQT
jgi:hypothetical protein